MTFAYKNLLWLLLVFPPALVVFFWWSSRKRQQLVTQFIQSRLLPSLTVGLSPTRDKVRFGCLIFSVICLLVALARPQWGFDWEEVKQRGLDIVVAIDTSKSMLAEDIAPNRLARAKLAALELMQQARSDRLGLVAFSGTAFLQCPLTIDDSAFRQSVESLDVNTLPQGGTAIAEAIDTALTAFREGDNHRAMVMFTDGEDHDSNALEAAKRAADAGMMIFTIGIGSAKGELLRVSDGKGRTDYVRDDQGNVVMSHLNESLLQEIARDTKGFYLPLRGAEAIDTLYKQGLAPLPKSDSSQKLVRHYHERYHWFLALAILALLVELLMPERKRKSASKVAGAKIVPPAVAATISVLFAILLPLSSPASPSSALHDYNEGKFDRSLKEYERLIEKKKDDPRLHFNAGAAAYQNKQYDDAAREFEQALNSPDLKLLQQAYYNRGNARFYQGEQNSDPEKKTKSWEDSLKDYESTLSLDPRDADAAFNREFVKRKLEELKQQQQKQDQNKQNDKDKNQDQKKDENQKQDQDNKQDKDQQKKDQQQDQKKDQKQNSKSDPKDSDKKDNQQKQSADEQKKKEEEKKKQQQAKDKKEQDKKEQQEQANKSPSKDEPGKKDEGQTAQAYPPGQMTPQQAKQLLDAQKGDEMIIPIKPEGKPRDTSHPLKDW